MTIYNNLPDNKSLSFYKKALKPLEKIFYTDIVFEGETYATIRTKDGKYHMIHKAGIIVLATNYIRVLKTYIFKAYTDGMNDFYHLYNSLDNEDIKLEYKVQADRLKKHRRAYMAYPEHSFGRGFKEPEINNSRLVVDCINFILKERKINPTLALI